MSEMAWRSQEAGQHREVAPFIGRAVLEMLPGSNFWLNPLSECQKPMPASEVALLVSGEIFELVKAAG